MLGQVASGAFDHSIRLWDVATGKEQASIKRAHNTVFCVRFSPDGKTLASSGWDAQIKLWDLATNKQIATFEIPVPPKFSTIAVPSIAFSPDGKTLVSGSQDKLIRLWDVSPAK